MQPNHLSFASLSEKLPDIILLSQLSYDSNEQKFEHFSIQQF